MTAGIYLLTNPPLVAAIAFIVVIFLAGPHAGILPAPLEAAVLALGWLAVLVIPALAAVKGWQRLGRRRVG